MSEPMIELRVTPLVAAPPPLGEDEADLVQRLDDAWAGKGEYADGDIDLLRGLCGEAKVAVQNLIGFACVAARLPQ